MPKMRAVQVSRPNGPFEMVEREIPEPGPGSVRIKVQACGICHSDSITKEGTMPWVQYPRVPGHEVAGVVDAVGAGVVQWTPGRRVGVGWNGGYCGYCDACRRGNFFACQTFTAATGITFDGGYAEYMIARAEAVAAMPDGLKPVDAAPLMCAGLTTYNCLRNSGARPGELEEDIRQTGFFNSKARSLRRAGAAMAAEHGGRVPDTMEALLRLPGVGRKTANVILGNAFGKDEGFVVDTHVGRVSRRLGLTRQTDPVRIEDDLNRLIPKGRRTMAAHELIFHGRQICQARRPLCDRCPVEPLCPKVGVHL
jgi:endonuclease III